MDRELLISKLREHKEELQRAGVDHLFLHGSYARGTAIREASDVDVIADFDRARKPSLIGRIHLENRLTDILGVKADLADSDAAAGGARKSAARVGPCLLSRRLNACSRTSWTLSG
jgi:predicted nucleotidyltransferase